MVFYKPYSDNTEIQKLFPETVLAPDAIYGAYVALEQDEPCGKCLVQIRDTACELVKLVCDGEDKLLTEGLVRAALHFAANRGAYAASCPVVGCYDDVLTMLGFTLQDGVYYGEIPTLLQGSCCHGKDGCGS